MSASEFYYACRNGKLDKVKQLLMSMSTAEIDHMEPNGSTALHAAAYYGHIDIVRLLLDKGASSDQKNKYDKTAEEEAKTPEIAELLHKIKPERDIHWAIDNAFTAISQHRRFYSFNQGPPTLHYVVDKLLSSEELRRAESTPDNNMDKAKSLFQEAIDCNDATNLIFAYTIESPFYHILNKTLAHHKELTNEERENPPWFCAYARFLASDEPSFRPYRWTGITFRGVRIPEQQVIQWQVGAMMMNKAFLSTSKDRHVALTFALHGVPKGRSTIFKCIVNDDRAALDISSIAEWTHEKEVLILPCMDFQITEVVHSQELLEVTLLLR